METPAEGECLSQQVLDQWEQATCPEEVSLITIHMYLVVLFCRHIFKDEFSSGRSPRNIFFAKSQRLETDVLVVIVDSRASHLANNATR